MSEFNMSLRDGNVKFGYDFNSVAEVTHLWVLTAKRLPYSISFRIPGATDTIALLLSENGGRGWRNIPIRGLKLDTRGHRQIVRIDEVNGNKLVSEARCRQKLEKPLTRYVFWREKHNGVQWYKFHGVFKIDVEATKASLAAGENVCVLVAEGMSRQGLKPAILNLASRFSPGGGYHDGTSAQEESLCQTSTLSQSLYQYGDTKYKHIRESGVSHRFVAYPLHQRFGGIYTPDVTFFRHGIRAVYAYREPAEWFRCGVITVPALSFRETNKYNNSEPEFDRRFKSVVFAILEGKGTARKPVEELGKFAPFYERFGRCRSRKS